jgi:hypothetical protein
LQLHRLTLLAPAPAATRSRIEKQEKVERAGIDQGDLSAALAGKFITIGGRSGDHGIFRSTS